MPAPVVLPLAENLGTAVNYAEKANQISENKCKLELGSLRSKYNETVAKMDKEMQDLKHELSQMKPKRGKRDGKKEPGRNSPQAKVTKVTASNSPCVENEENSEPKRRSKPGDSMAERSEQERINNLHRRYSAQLRADVSFKSARKSAEQKR